jgi:undecaprenyl-diphosphatase
LQFVAALLAFSTCKPAALLLAQDPVVPEGRRYWIDAGILTGTALLLDRPVRGFVAAHQTRALDHVAEALDPLGRAEYIVPSLAAAIVLPAAIGNRPVAWNAMRVAAGYAAADLAGGVFRVIVARHRPDLSGNPWRFRPLHPQGDWGSMPSAHVTHAFALAAGVAEVSGRPLAGGLVYGLAAMVAAQRVYRQAHWGSDVVVGATLSTEVSRRVIRLLRRDARAHQS